MIVIVALLGRVLSSILLLDKFIMFKSVVNSVLKVLRIQIKGVQYKYKGVLLLFFILSWALKISVDIIDFQ